MPASGFDMRMAAMPHVAIPQDGSWISTSRNDFPASLYQKECSMATERWKLACTAGLQELAKSTLPSWSLDWLSEARGMASTRASSNTARNRFAFMQPPVRARRCALGVGFLRIGLPASVPRNRGSNTETLRIGLRRAGCECSLAKLVARRRVEAARRWPSPHSASPRASEHTPSAHRRAGPAPRARFAEPPQASPAPRPAVAPRAAAVHPAAGTGARRRARARPDNPPHAPRGGVADTTA